MDKTTRNDLARCVALVEAGRNELAVRCLRELLSEHPAHVEAGMMLGDLLVALGDWRAAIAQLRRTVRFSPVSTDARTRLASITREFEGPLAALDIAQELIAISPHDDWGHHLSAHYLRELGRYQEAARAYETAIALNPHEVGYWLNLGVVSEELAQTGQAIEAYHQVLRLNPDNRSGLWNLSLLYSQLDRHSDALSLLRRILDILRSEAAEKAEVQSVQTRLGKVLLEAGEPWEAVSELRQAASLGGSDDEANRLLAEALTRVHGQPPRQGKPPMPP